MLIGCLVASAKLSLREFTLVHFGERMAANLWTSPIDLNLRSVCWLNSLSYNITLTIVIITQHHFSIPRRAES